MNAILVFDPSNDLLFAKTNRLFSLKILKYAKLNGLIPNDYYKTSRSSKSHLCRPNQQNLCDWSSSDEKEEQDVYGRADNRKNPTRKRPSNTKSNRPLSGGRSALLEDTEKQYLEILMLLLTPYIASLRLNNSLPRDPPKKPNRRRRKLKDPTGSGRLLIEEDSDMLDKFMSSVHTNHECTEDGSSSADSMEEPEHREEFSSRRNISTVEMPIDCLKDCQIVYCQMFDFIFVYMQQLNCVSSFKMRLLQKRIDLFAKLAMLLFGPALNHLRISRSVKSGPRSPNETQQSLVLRQLHETWLEHQFEPEFMLEACERLIVSKHIEQLCERALRRISLQLRQQHQLRKYQETHQHALLYSSTKLISKFSCRNSQPLDQGDLILILLMLKTFNKHHGNEFTDSNSYNNQDQENLLSDQLLAKLKLTDQIDDNDFCCYTSNFSTNRNTSEINSSSSSDLMGAILMGRRSSLARRKKSLKQQQHYLQQKRKILLQNEQLYSANMPTSVQNQKFSSQQLVFLSNDIRTPHVIRFISLTKGITLILISELATSYLCLKFNKILKIINEFNSASAANNSKQLIKLNQLAEVNDSVCAIKSYFYGENYQDVYLDNKLAFQLDELDSSSIDDELKSSQQSTSTGIFSNLFKQKPKRQPPTKSQEQEKAPESVYSKLGVLDQRQCCRLLCRLEDLVSSNIHTYMRQTFGLTSEEDLHKREALLTSVASTVRDSIETFIIKPQLTKFDGCEQETDHELVIDQTGLVRSNYKRQISELMDEVRLFVRKELSDYLDYLAVKANCNVTMGAPLTHDMKAIRSFIYVDRTNQKLILSPMKRNSSLILDKQALLEGDISLDYNSMREEISGDEDDDHDELTNSSSDISVSSSTSALHSEDPKLANGNEADLETDDQDDRPISGGLRKKTLGRNSNSRWLMGASADLLVDKRQTGNYHASLFNLSSTKRTQAGTKVSLLSSEICDSSSGLGTNTTPSSLTTSSSGQESLIDENLIQGFTCFAYNRLAQGKTSYSGNDGTYVYSYFLCFKRNSSVRSSTNSLPLLHAQPHNHLEA